MITKPMLASTAKAEDLENLNWPALVSAKIDGIRCMIHPTLGPVTRSFKPVPNVHIREQLLIMAKDSNLDGELIIVDPEKGGAIPFNAIQSGVMSRSGRPDFVFCAFDIFRAPDEPYLERFVDTEFIVDAIGHPRIQVVHHTYVANAKEFMEIAAQHIDQGYEGSMIRHLDGPYKSGRSTLKQGWLLKYKAWADAEGTIVGFEELMHNENPDLRDNFDRAKRSSHKANMVPANTLGALVLSTNWGTLRVGTGFDASLRQEIWDRNMVKQLNEGRWIIRGPQPDINRTVTFKYQAHGMQDKPRFPVFKGFRED